MTPEEILAMQYKRIGIPHANIFLRNEVAGCGNIRKSEPETFSWIKRYIGKKDVLFDIGANVGVISLVATHLNKNVTAYAFEPSWFNFNYLTDHVLYNNCEDKMYPFNIAISHEETCGFLNHYKLGGGRGLHNLGSSLLYTGQKFEEKLRQCVFTTTIDKLVFDYGLPAPNHIKIDIDGRELDVIKGAAKTIRNSAFKSMLVEIMKENKRSDRLLQYVEDLGLTVRTPKHAGNINYICTKNDTI